MPIGVKWVVFAAASMLGGGVAVAGGSQTSSSSQKAAPRYDLVIQDCAGLETQSDGGESLTPAGGIRLFLDRQAGRRVNIDFTKAVITVLTPPTNGKLVPDKTMSPVFGPGYFYAANHGYTGKDKIVYAIQVGGKNVKVEQILNVVPIYNGNSETFCSGKPSHIKRISAADIQSDRIVWRKAQRILLGLQFARSDGYYLSNVKTMISVSKYDHMTLTLSIFS